LLLEREKVRRPAGDDGGLNVVLDIEWTERRLEDQELADIVNGLINYVA
jgi:hypothetical protein